MPIDCESVNNITINGSRQAFGGSIYNLNVSISYNSASEFEIDFVSESGDYDISDEDLNSETASILVINEKRIHVLPLSYNVSKSPSGNLLSVRYKDLSVKYLDKTVIGLRGIHVTNDQENESDKIIAIGKKVTYKSTDDSGEIEISNSEEDFSFSGQKSVYTSEQLFVEISQKIPCSGNFETALTSEFNTYRIVKDYHGNLRSVLQSWGSDLGYVFFWNFLEGEGGAIDAINIRQGFSSNQAKNLSEEIRKEYYKYITSYNYGESIEDTFSKSGTLLAVLNSGSSTAISGKDKFESYNLFEFKANAPPERRNWVIDYGASSSDIYQGFHIKIGGQRYRFNDEQFRAAVAAASLGPTFYKEFVFHCINSYLRIKTDDFYKVQLLGRRELRSGNPVVPYDPGISFDYSDLIAKYYWQYLDVASPTSKPKFIGYFDYRIVQNTSGQLFSVFTGQVVPSDIAVNVESLSMSAREIIQQLKLNPETYAILKAGGGVIASYLNLNAYRNKDLGNIFDNMENDELFIQLNLYAKYNNRFFYKTYNGRDSFEKKSYSGNTQFFLRELSTEQTPFQEVATYVSGGKNVQIQPFVEDGQLYTNVIQPTEEDSLEDDAGIAIYDAGSKIVIPSSVQRLSFAKKLDTSDFGFTPYSEATLFVTSDSMSNVYRTLVNAEVKTEIDATSINVPFTTVGSSGLENPGVNVQIYRRVINDLKDDKIAENELSLEEISVEELSYSRYLFLQDNEEASIKLSDIIDKFAEHEFHSQNEPSFFAEFSMSTLPVPKTNWFRDGLDSISISYGSEGVNCSMRISTQRRASETLDVIRNGLAKKASLSKFSRPMRRSVWNFPPKYRGRFRRA